MTKSLSPLSDFGDHFIVALDGTSFTNIDGALLTELRPLGVFLDGDNFLKGAPYGEWLAALRDLLAKAKAACGRERILVAIDHEGGRVYRTPAPVTRFPYAADYARFSAAVGEAQAVELRSLGINLLFGPVADIHSNPANPVIGSRALGATAAEVTRAALAYKRAVQALGIRCCAKHFPGHGDTATDSHLVLPRVDRSEEELLSRELLPFEALIDDGISCVMTSHISFPQIDARYPATLSKPILTGLLRGRLGFGGVIITDDIDMKGLSDAFSEEEIATRVVQAGVDVFLFNHKPQRAVGFAKTLAQAVATSPSIRDALSLSRKRIARLVKSVKENPVVELSDEVFASHQGLCTKIMKTASAVG